MQTCVKDRNCGIWEILFQCGLCLETVCQSKFQCPVLKKYSMISSSVCELVAKSILYSAALNVMCEIVGFLVFIIYSKEHFVVLSQVKNMGRCCIISR